MVRVEVPQEKFQIQRTDYVQAGVTPDDPRDALQIVGFFEYVKALEHFNALLKEASPEELEAIDEIVAERPELAVFSNLSRHLEGIKGPLSEPVEPGGYRQQSFAWVVALARLEVAAINAAFSSQPRPFSAVGHSEFDRAAYGELLMDGLRSHVWALLYDPELEPITRNSAKSERLLAYLRRVYLAQRMAAGAMLLYGKQMSPPQRMELIRWGQQLAGLRERLVGNVNERLAAMSGVLGTEDRRVKTPPSSRTYVTPR